MAGMAIATVGYCAQLGMSLGAPQQQVQPLRQRSSRRAQQQLAQRPPVRSLCMSSSFFDASSVRTPSPWEPRLGLGPQEVVELQLEALKRSAQRKGIEHGSCAGSDKLDSSWVPGSTGTDLQPIDFGLQVLFNFAAYSCFAPSRYFGYLADLGKFDNFKMKFFQSGKRGTVRTRYRALLKLQSYSMLSVLQISDERYACRVHVDGGGGEQTCFTFIVKQEVGGRKDGVWLTESLVNDHAIEK
eukprot:jgi/Chlat1/5315/Chrsp35S08983